MSSVYGLHRLFGSDLVERYYLGRNRIKADRLWEKLVLRKRLEALTDEQQSLLVGDCLEMLEDSAAAPPAELAKFIKDA